MQIDEIFFEISNNTFSNKKRYFNIIYLRAFYVLINYKATGFNNKTRELIYSIH